MKTLCNIGLSSMTVWIYINGDINNPIRGGSDANCNVFYGDIEKTDKDADYFSEKYMSHTFLEYSKDHVIKIRTGWDGFSDEKFYGVIETKPNLMEL